MTLPDWIFLTALAVVAVLVLNDAINGTTAAVRELIDIQRKGKP